MPVGCGQQGVSGRLFSLQMGMLPMADLEHSSTWPRWSTVPGEMPVVFWVVQDLHSMFWGTLCPAPE